MTFFDVFNHPFRITRVDVTEAYRDQTTGAFVPESEVETDILGSFDRGIVEMRLHGVGGVTHSGSVRFYTEDALEENDCIRVYFDAGETEFRTYRVVGVAQEYSWLTSIAPGTGARHEYRLALKQRDE